MLVEHAIITTIEAQECFERVHGLMSHLGFLRRSDATGEAIYKRGEPRPKNHAPLTKLPQSVAIRFDRGRVNIAASIQAFRDKSDPTHNQLLLKLASAIELQINTLDEGERIRAVQPLLDEIKAIQEANRRGCEKRKKKGCYTAIGLAVFIALLFTIIIVIAANG